jgi:hypothetical protein
MKRQHEEQGPKLIRLDETGPHIQIELLDAMGVLDLEHIPYKPRPHIVAGPTPVTETLGVLGKVEDYWGVTHSGTAVSKPLGFYGCLRRALQRLEPQMLEAMWFDLAEGKWGPLEGATHIEKVIFLVKHFQVHEELSGVYDWIKREAPLVYHFLPPRPKVAEQPEEDPQLG